MTSDEFLALVGKHPLPWRCIGDSRDEGMGYLAHSDYAMPMEQAATAQELADAAPALAAAAIRLLREGSDDYGGDCAFCGADPREHLKECTWAALRAALPEELR